MKVLLTGSNGYIGTRLLHLLSEQGHEIVAVARNIDSVHVPERVSHQVTLIKGDFLNTVTVSSDIEAAYYLIHSMTDSLKAFDVKDRIAATNFLETLKKTSCKQIIYLTGLISNEGLSKHLQSRLEVEKILQTSKIPVTVFRAGIVIGAGSASFEIIRDLIEKLPIMVAPRWVCSRCQPIAIRDVMFYLSEALGNQQCLNRIFDIGGPDVLTYKEMLYQFAKFRNLRRLIISVPFLTPKLSSLWLLFVTSTSYFLARTLVDSMTLDAVCNEHAIDEVLPRKCLPYKEAIAKSFEKIQENAVVSSWRDSWSSGGSSLQYHEYIKVPEHGCINMRVSKGFHVDPQKVYDVVYSIGDCTGYFSMNWAWRIRGLIDRLIGGVGICRGRTHRKTIRPGDVIDFWRVIQVDNEHRHLVLFAEMKVPGEAWLEFYVHKDRIEQIATFRPKGVWGRIYWWAFWPVHLVMFPGMLRTIIRQAENNIAAQKK